jgi:phosphomannomutase
MSIFKAYDIRGIYNKGLTDQIAYKIGYFIPKLLKTNKVLVGRDMRVSSPALFTSLCQGLTDAGATVYNAGLCTTPMVYYGTAHFGFEASIMITASHNPGKYNGLKITQANAMPVGFDDGLGLLEQMVTNDEISISKVSGTVIPYSKELQDSYFPFLNSFKYDFSNLNIGVDCSNGCSGYFVRQVLGESPLYINDLPDGTFPNHEPNPLEPENIVQLQQLVQDESLDVGVIFDGDADRVMFTDEKGRFISPDLLIAAMAHYYGPGEGRIVLHDIRTSRAVKEYLEKLGYSTHMWRVGRAYAAVKLREIAGLYGGELAGHYYFSQFFFSDSGFIASMILLDVFARFKEQGITVSMLIEKIKGKWANTGEINFRITHKQEAMDAVRDYFIREEQPVSNLDFDGYRVDFPNWWFNIRPSNTEPYLRFIAEADHQDLLDEKQARLQQIIEQFLDK